MRIIYLLFIIIIAILATYTQAQIPQGQVQALTDINTLFQLGWNLNSICTIPAVECNPTQTGITGLSLPPLSATSRLLPESLSSISTLLKLSITGEVFGANIDIPYYDFKESPYLTELYLNSVNNMLSSNIEYPMVNMHPVNGTKASLIITLTTLLTLTRFDLSPEIYDKIRITKCPMDTTSSIPQKLDFSTFTVFDVSGNSIYGTVPPGLCQARRPSDVVRIDLHNNNPLTGRLPNCFSCSIDLWHQFFMGNNQLGNLDLSSQWKWEGCPTLAFMNADNIRVPTSGGKITINGTDFGWDAVPVSSSSPSATVVLPNKMLSFDVPPGTGGLVSHTYTLLVGRMNQTFEIGYLQPNVSLVVIPIYGNFLQLIGTNFGNDIAKVSVFIDGVQEEVLELDYTSMNVSSTNYKFTNLTVVVDDQESIHQKVNRVMVELYPPTVTYYTPIYYGQMSNITINGTDLLSVLDVSIGNKTCIPMSVSKSQIVCSFAADVPVVNGTALPITMVNGDNRFYSFNIFLYRQRVACPTGIEDVTCSDHGTCNEDSGQCTCTDGYGGSACAFKVSESKTEPIPTSFGLSVVSSDNLNAGSFLVGVGYLREVDVNKKTVRTRQLSDAQWSYRKISVGLTTYIGTYNGTNITITIDMTVYRDATTINFAQDIIEIASNSVKHHIVITNYPFQSTSNSLQVIYRTALEGPKCTTTNNSQVMVNANDRNNAANYEVSTRSSVLVSRYARTIIVDKSVVLSNAVILDDQKDELVRLQKPSVVLTMIQVPYFRDSVVLDPNYNILVKSMPDLDECPGSGATSWILPVATVVSLVITAIIVQA
eukprot:gene17016-20261_t